MKTELDALVKLFENKFPSGDFPPFPKIVLYGDGSCHIENPATEPFAFENIENLIDYLRNEEIQPWY